MNSTVFTITSKVVVYAPSERAEKLPISSSTFSPLWFQPPPLPVALQPPSADTRPLLSLFFSLTWDLKGGGGVLTHFTHSTHILYGQCPHYPAFSMPFQFTVSTVRTVGVYLGYIAAFKLHIK